MVFGADIRPFTQREHIELNGHLRLGGRGQDEPLQPPAEPPEPPVAPLAEGAAGVLTELDDGFELTPSPPKPEKEKAEWEQRRALEGGMSPRSRSSMLELEGINEELLESDEDVKLTAADVKDIQASVMQGVFGAMSTEGRYTLIDADRAYIKSRVRAMCEHILQPPPERRFAKLERVMCNIGRPRGWAPGSVQAINEDDPSDVTGQTRLAYVVKIDPPDSRLVSVPQDNNACVRAEVCFGQRAGALWFTRMCLPKALRRGAQRASARRFGVGERVACAVEDSEDSYTEWAAGTVEAVDHHVEDEDGVRGGLCPYRVLLDSGSTVLAHADEHWLVRDLALQPAGQRYAPKRIEKRKAADEGWEMVDHMTRKARKVVDECLSCDDDED